MRQNLDPAVWGPGAWDFLHNVISAADENTRGSYDSLMLLLPDILPCESCREHAGRYVREHPPQSSASLDSWLRDFERSVAARRRSENAERRRSQRRARKGAPWQLVWVLILLVLALALASFSQR